MLFIQNEICDEVLHDPGKHSRKKDQQKSQERDRAITTESAHRNLGQNRGDLQWRMEHRWTATHVTRNDKEEFMKMLSTSDVLDSHLKSFADCDVEGVVSDYSSDAVLFVPGGPVRSRID